MTNTRYFVLSRLKKIALVLAVGFYGKSFVMAQERVAPDFGPDFILAQNNTGRTTVTVQPTTFYPDIVGNNLFAGKKAVRTDFEKLPEITTNNLRQIFAKTPGLLTSEVSNEGFLSVNYRGVGDPHESFNVQILRDGIPISADPFGYPAAYFAPPIEAVGELEFVQGGAALLYGPQPGGALNFISPQVSTKPWEFSTKHVVGSKGLYSTFTNLEGSKDNVSYRGYLHHRETDGFRRENGDYQVNNAYISTTYAISPDTKWTFTADVYDSDHGEAGGLGVVPGEGIATFQDDRWASTRLYDRLRIQRYAPTLSLVHMIDQDTSVTVDTWVSFLDRYSKRQDLGDAASFGGIANGTTNTISHRQFYTVGARAKAAHSYSFGDTENTATLGLQVINVNAPLVEKKGDTPFSESGITQKKFDRNTFASSIYAENLMTLGKFSLTPGVRVENLFQDIDERQNVGVSPEDLRSNSDFSAVPLFGLGAAYELSSQVDLYANVSQGYRPKTYEDAVPQGAGDLVNSDLNESNVISYESGVRGQSSDWLSWETGFFLVNYDDQVGRVENAIRNVGEARYQGWEASTDLDLFGASDAIFDSSLNSFGSLSLFGNVSLLDAEFTRGPIDGFTPQYAPKYMSRVGLAYRREQIKVAFLGTLMGNHYGDDANTAERNIPSYRVWDLTAETNVYSNNVALMFGLNNVFDERYFSRVRGNGIEPALPRNWYSGIKVSF